jgi:CHAT domain-containing protein
VSSPPGDRNPLALAELAHARVQAEPRSAAADAERALALARGRHDREAEAAALHALGFARYELNDPRAIATLRAAVRTAERHGFPRRAALARRPLATCLAAAGRMHDALREIDAACDALEGVELARSEVSRLSVLGASGRAPASLESSARALRTLRRAGDTIWEARLLKNRGYMRSLRGDAAGSRLDLERARDLYASLGQTLGAAGAEIALARSALLDGDVVGCMAELDAAERRELPPRARCVLELFRAEALVEARLADEADAALRTAETLWQHAGQEDWVRKVRLEAARLSLLSGDAQAARARAEAARRTFAAKGQPVYAARSAAIALEAAIAAGDVPDGSVAGARRAAAVLAGAGWRHDALRSHLLAARAAVGLGRLGVARRELEACSALGRRGNAGDRIGVRHAEALLRLARGDRAGGLRALRAGLRLLDDYRAAFTAAELRVNASGLGVELARAGLRLAVEDGDPRAVLWWSERQRASALRLPRVRPPDDPELRESEATLRRVGAAIRQAEDDDRPTRALVSRQIALETAIRRRSRHATADAGAALRSPSAAALARRLGERTLVVFVELDGALRAVTLRDGRLATHELGPAAAVGEQLVWLRFALGRLARTGGSVAARAAALAGAEDAAGALDRLVVRALGAGPLVIVPTGALHAIPWGALPSLHGRPVAVAPSAAVWLGLEERSPRGHGGVVLAAGPRLEHAATEVADIARVLPGAAVLTGPGATSTALLRALDGAALAHVASHGRFRADSPLFSSFELADGEVTALDLQRLRHAPELLVLSACDLALSDRRPGDELLGVAAALLGMGTRTIVAGVVPVPDRTAHRLMLTFHERLAAGSRPAAALAAAQAEQGAQAGFVCLGAG